VHTDRFDAHAGGPSGEMTGERLQKIVAQYPLGRVGRADDVTPMVLLLASPRASWITGQVVSVNGGYAML
jgi:2-hydroxycyclohexanecarboxyl-CoA dehydrogenase